MVGVAQLQAGAGGPGGPAGGQRRLVPDRRGFLPAHRDGHGDDEREEAVVPGTLGVQALRVGGAPRPARLLVETTTRL